MRGPSPAPFALAAALAFAGGARLAAPPPRPAAEEPAEVLFAQDSPGKDPAAESSQKLSDSGDSFTAEYGFENFNRDRLTLRFKMPKDDFKAYEAAWGYKTADINALKAWLNKARQDALADASAHGRSQAQLNEAVADLQKDYKRKLAEYFASRCFTASADGTVRVDMPALVRKNAPLVKSLAKELDDYSKMKRYGSDDVIGAAAALVQTAILYRVPPTLEGDRHTGGVLPPVSALVKGWGDCDTKSGLLASVLTNYSTMRMVGISVPDHYLVGVLGIPHRGQVFVEYEGLQYVLIEPAGPAWLPPGIVADTTSALLANADGYKIQPFF